MSWVSSKCSFSSLRKKRGKTNLFVVPICLASVLVVNSENLENLLNGRLKKGKNVNRGKRTVRNNTDQFLSLGLVCQSVGVRPCCLLHGFDGLLDPFDILETKFRLDNFHVAKRVDVTLDVNDLGVVKGTNDLENTVHSANMGQEGVSEASPRRRTLHGVKLSREENFPFDAYSGEAGNIDTGEERRDARGGLVNVA